MTSFRSVRGVIAPGGDAIAVITDTMNAGESPISITIPIPSWASGQLYRLTTTGTVSPSGSGEWKEGAVILTVAPGASGGSWCLDLALCVDRTVPLGPLSYKATIGTKVEEVLFTVIAHDKFCRSGPEPKTGDAKLAMNMMFCMSPEQWECFIDCLLLGVTMGDLVPRTTELVQDLVEREVAKVLAKKAR